MKIGIFFGGFSIESSKFAIGNYTATCISHQSAKNRYNPSNFIHKLIDYNLNKKVVEFS